MTRCLTSKNGESQHPVLNTQEKSSQRYNRGDNWKDLPRRGVRLPS